MDDDEIDLPLVIEVPLPGGRVTKVDTHVADKHKLLESVLDVLPAGYVRFRRNGKWIYLHRAAFGLADSKKSLAIAHINGDKLDNRRRNLKLRWPVDQAKAYAGVAPSGHRFQAAAQSPETHKRIALGTYYTREEAACAFYYAGRLLRGPNWKPLLLDGDKLPSAERLAEIFGQVALRLAEARAKHEQPD